MFQDKEQQQIDWLVLLTHILVILIGCLGVARVLRQRRLVQPSQSALRTNR